MSVRPRDQAGLRAPSSVIGAQRLQPRTLPSGVAFWVVAAIALLVFAANTAASPLYRIYQSQLRFSTTTLTALFATYIVFLVVTLLWLGSLSDYVGRRRVMAAGLVAGAVACALYLIAHGIVTLFAARACQGLAVGLISGAAGAALLDLRPERRSGAARVQRSGNRRPGARCDRRQRAGAIRPRADPPGLVAAARGVRHRDPGRAGDAGAGQRAPGHRRAVAPARQRAPRSARRVRRGGARAGGRVGPRRLLPVAGTVTRRPAPPFPRT